MKLSRKHYMVEAFMDVYKYDPISIRRQVNIALLTVFAGAILFFVFGNLALSAGFNNVGWKSITLVFFGVALLVVGMLWLAIVEPKDQAFWQALRTAAHFMQKSQEEVVAMEREQAEALAKELLLDYAGMLAASASMLDIGGNNIVSCLKQALIRAYEDFVALYATLVFVGLAEVGGETDILEQGEVKAQKEKLISVEVNLPMSEDPKVDNSPEKKTYVFTASNGKENKLEARTPYEALGLALARDLEPTVVVNLYGQR